MTAEDLQRIWETQIVGKLRPVAAGLFREATVLAHERNVVTVRLGAGVPLAQARRRSNEAEAILSALLDQTVRLEVSDAGGQPSSAPPADRGDQADTAAGTPAEPPRGEPAASDAAQQPGTAGPTTSAVSQEAAAPASSHEDKVQRIVDRFPGSVVVRDDESAT